MPRRDWVLPEREPDAKRQVTNPDPAEVPNANRQAIRDQRAHYVRWLLRSVLTRMPIVSHSYLEGRSPSNGAGQMWPRTRKVLPSGAINWPAKVILGKKGFVRQVRFEGETWLISTLGAALVQIEPDGKRVFRRKCGKCGFSQRLHSGNCENCNEPFPVVPKIDKTPEPF